MDPHIIALRARPPILRYRAIHSLPIVAGTALSSHSTETARFARARSDPSPARRFLPLIHHA